MKLFMTFSRWEAECLAVSPPQLYNARIFIGLKDVGRQPSSCIFQGRIRAPNFEMESLLVCEIMAPSML